MNIYTFQISKVCHTVVTQRNRMNLENPVSLSLSHYLWQVYILTTQV